MVHFQFRGAGAFGGVTRVPNKPRPVTKPADGGADILTMETEMFTTSHLIFACFSFAAFAAVCGVAVAVHDATIRASSLIAQLS